MKNTTNLLSALVLILFCTTEKTTAQDIVQDKEGNPLLVDYGVGFVTANVTNASIAIGGTVFYYDRLRLGLGFEGKATNGIASLLKSSTIVPGTKLNADIGISVGSDSTYFLTAERAASLSIELATRYPKELDWLGRILDSAVNKDTIIANTVCSTLDSLEILLNNFKESKDLPNQEGLRNFGSELIEKKDRINKSINGLTSLINEIRDIVNNHTVVVSDSDKAQLKAKAGIIRSKTDDSANNSSLFRLMTDYIRDLKSSQWPNAYVPDVSWINLRFSISANNYHIFVPSNPFDDRIIDTTLRGFLGLASFNRFLTRERLYLSIGLGAEYVNNGNQLSKASVIQRTTSPSGDNETTTTEEKTEAITGDFKEYWNRIFQFSAYWKIHHSLPLSLSSYVSYRHGDITRPISLGLGLYRTKKTNTFQPVVGFLLEYRDETINRPSDDRLIKRFGGTITTSIPFSIN